MPFEDMAHVACVEQAAAVELAGVFEREAELGETLLARLAKAGACDRVTFAGKPVADLYPGKPNKDRLRELHVFAVDVTRGEVLGRTRVYILLAILHDKSDA